MKRLVLVLAAMCLCLAAGAPRVAAGGGIVDQGLSLVERTVNPVLENVPTPPGWHDRDACVILYTIDRSVCVYFPFPF